MIRRVSSLMTGLAGLVLTLPAAACADIRRDEPLVDILLQRNLVTPQDEAASPPAAANALSPAGLPAQTLEAGECGAFFWDRAEPNPLILFENETRGAANMWIDGAVIRMTTAPRVFSYQSGQALRRTYVDGALSISLTGEVTDLRSGEAIIGRALMRRQQTDGTEIVRPLVGLISCRE